MSTLPHELYTAEGVRALDRLTIEAGTPGIELMTRAGEAACRYLLGRWPDSGRIVVLCGGGNNGGDGYIIARCLRKAGRSVHVLHVVEPERLGGDAATAARQAAEAGVPMAPFGKGALEGVDLVVDALLGTGLSGEVRQPFAGAIDAINEAGVPVLAIDIPSGLDADTGAVLGHAVRASATVTFIGLKRGLFTGEGPALCGEMIYEDLQMAPDVAGRVAPSALRLDGGLPAGYLAPRSRTAHKGHFGHVLVVGGDHGTGGAARMAAEAALRCGAGLVSVATRAENTAPLTAARPELMCHGVERPAQLGPLLERATVVALGPGLGTGNWGAALMARVVETHRPMVLDADALNLLAQEPLRHDNWVLTPHPGEAGRLLGCSAAEIQQDRFAAAAAIEASYGGVVVLKGAGTVIADGRELPRVCCAGNPGMASGGMGDLLTGIIAALLAQGFGPAEAARIGACVHAEAADRAAQAGERGMIATDLLPVLRTLVNPGR